jgi:hypothetical protein
MSANLLEEQDLLHHSEGGNDFVFGLTNYLDDSGSDDPSPLVTCGGVVMDRANFNQFSKRWTRMYERNRRLGDYVLEPPMHMTDFVGMGRYAGPRSRSRSANSKRNSVPKFALLSSAPTPLHFSVSFC